MSELFPSWKELNLAAIISQPGNSVEYKTGDWKTHYPVVDHEKCIKCGTCWSFCPEYAFEVDQEGRFVANRDYCKGCGICAEECPKKCITMVEEEAE